MYNPKEHHRRSIRLKEYDYSEPNQYYITICTHDRKNLFGEIKNSKMVLDDYGKIVNEEWLRTKELRKNIDLDDYVIMPNHIHGILIIERRGKMHLAPTDAKFSQPAPGSLSTIIGSFKASVTRRINKLLKKRYKFGSVIFTNTSSAMKMIYTTSENILN